MAGYVKIIYSKNKRWWGTKIVGHSDRNFPATSLPWTHWVIFFSVLAQKVDEEEGKNVVKESKGFGGLLR